MSDTTSALVPLPGPDTLDAIPLDAIPLLLGRLRQLEAELWRRMMPTSCGATASEPLQVTADDAAKLLAFQTSYVLELARKGELPCIRRGKYVRFALADLHAWVQRHRVDEVDPIRPLVYSGGSGTRRARRRLRPSEVS